MGADDYDEAVDYLGHALARREPLVLLCHLLPVFRPLHEIDEFRSFVRTFLRLKQPFG